MKFKATTISPKGRNKYGNYLSASNVTGKVINTLYSGNDSTTNIGGGTDGKEDNNKKSFLIFLSKTSNSFDGEEISLQAVTDTVKVIGYCDTYVADTYIGEPTGTWTTDSDGNTTWTDGTPQVNYSITGIPTSGMTVTVANNGTKQTTINISVDSTISATNGTLAIPVRVYLGGNSTDESIGDDESEWMSEKDNCVIMNLEYSWNITSSASSPYTMVLTNDSAAINCDIDGNILAGAVRPNCTAQLYYGTELVSDAVYGLSTHSSQNVKGLSIDSGTGGLSFGSDFSFTGTPLEITITASKGEKTLGRKIMTVAKNFPGTNGKDGKDGVDGKDGADGRDGIDGVNGKDGVDAVTRWLQLSSTTVKYNPNTGTLSPSTITAKCIKQVGEDEPVEDSTQTIYYGYNTSTPNTVYTGAVTVKSTYSYITFGLKNSSNKFYETQTVQVLSDGENGKDGTDGESVYNLVLSNQSASINADSDGNILTGAVRPTCTATLYYGQTQVTNASYSISTDAIGVNINPSTGVITFNSGNASTPFSFSGTSVEITVTATVGSREFKAIMTVSKSVAGKDGKDGDSVTVSSTSTTYAVTTDSAQPSDSKFTYTSIPNMSLGSYLWSKTVVVYSDGSSTKSYSVSRIGSDGSDGTNGSDGKTTHFAYSTSADGKSNFSTTLFAGATYIGTYDDYNTADSTDYTKYKWTKLKGDDGTDVTITSTSVQYQTSASGTEIPTDTWSNSVISATDSQPYLWTKTVVTYSDGQSTTAYSVAYKGRNGSDATSYWLILSATSVKVDVNNGNKCTPSTITASAYKQIGESAPVLASDCVIKYGYNVSVPTSTYTGAVTVDSSKNYLTFMLLNKDGKQVDLQTVQILKDGLDGKDGKDGLKGASIRGAVNWYSQTSTRRFCNGVYNADYPEDSMWIDIILKDDVYYYCNTSYTGSSNDSWSSVSSNWTVAENQFDFVATQVLLANNGKIKFLSSNQLTMMGDDGNSVVAGMSGGDGVNIWAGGDNPSTAPFRVDYNGSVTATKGSFGCLTIGDETVGGINEDVLKGTSDLGDSGEYNLSLSPRGLNFSGKIDDSTTYVNISPTYGVGDINDSNGQVESVVENSDDVGFYTNGVVDANQVRKSSNFYETEQRYLYNPWSYVQGLKLIICFGDESKITRNTTTKTWLCCGIDTGISYVKYPYKANVSSTSIQVYWKTVTDDDGNSQAVYKTLTVPDKYLGYWIFTGINSDEVPIYAFSGFGGLTLLSTTLNLREADTIYLQI